MAFIFPNSDFDRPDVLLDTLGSFWAEVYGDRDFVRSLVTALGAVDAHSRADFADLVRCLSRFNVPVYATEEWLPLRLRESERNQTEANLPRYDSSHEYSDSTLLRYGEPVDTTLHCWGLPEAVVDVRLIFNRITEPSLTFVHGLDFDLDNDFGVVRFRSNPFDHPLVAITDVTNGSAVVDREAVLWLYRSQRDRQYLHEQYGYVVGLPNVSSEAFKTLLNGVYDGLVQGTSRRAVETVLSALTGVPLATADGIVEAIFDDGRFLWVTTATDVHAYHRDAVPIVAAGDSVYAGQPLTDALQIFEFNRGEVPDALRALAVDTNFLSYGYFGGLIFENKTVPWIVETDEAGRAKVSFEIGGFPGDVDRFWDDVHNTAVAAGTSLARLIDTRANPYATAEPTALTLPDTVNPLEFLAANIFRHHLTVVVLKPGTFGDAAIGLHQADVLRKLLLPHTAMIMSVEVSSAESVVMDGAGDAADPGYTETQSSFIGLTIAETMTPDGGVEETATIRSSPGYLG